MNLLIVVCTERLLSVLLSPAGRGLNTGEGYRGSCGHKSCTLAVHSAGTEKVDKALAASSSRAGGWGSGAGAGCSLLSAHLVAGDFQKSPPNPPPCLPGRLHCVHFADDKIKDQPVESFVQCQAESKDPCRVSNL